MAEIPIADSGTGYGASTERPLGVTILAILQILGGLMMLVLGALATLAGLLFILFAIVGVAMAILGLLGLVVGFGLWGLKSWAWTWAMIVNILTIIFGLFNLASNFVSIIISLIIVIYLNQPDIKRRFR
ncbi:MAG: hypothetical protein RTV72_16675 [Candidatus Thorarchaeota archaeon]